MHSILRDNYSNNAWTKLQNLSRNALQERRSLSRSVSDVKSSEEIFGRSNNGTPISFPRSWVPMQRQVFGPPEVHKLLNHVADLIRSNSRIEIEFVEVFETLNRLQVVER
jgi:hypothetical protein